MLSSKAARHHDWLERAFVAALFIGGAIFGAAYMANHFGLIHL
jgi:uncharacterized membrane protein YoaK (UPF0700 family)